MLPKVSELTNVVTPDKLIISSIQPEKEAFETGTLLSMECKPRGNVLLHRLMQYGLGAMVERTNAT